MSDNPGSDAHGFPAVEEYADAESSTSNCDVVSAGTMDGEASILKEVEAREGAITDEWRAGPAKEELQVTIRSCATQFVSHLGFRGEQSVKVFVGPEKSLYIVPRDLLCHHSEYFRASFMGNFKEGVEQTSRLEETDEKQFQYMLQWIITGDIRLNEEPQFITLEDARRQFKEYIDFLVVADMFLINPSPATAIAEKLLKLMKDRSPEVDTFLFNGAIIKQLWTLPPLHFRPIRELIIKKCIMEYVLYRSDECSYVTKFTFQQELATVPEFAMDLLYFGIKFVQQRKHEVRRENNLVYIYRGFKDPITETVFEPTGMICRRQYAKDGFEAPSPPPVPNGGVW